MFPVVVLILARDEASVIGRSISSLLPQLGSSDWLHVVADHCRDETAEVARAAGAQVQIRQVGDPGKGQALSWWLERLPNLEAAPAGVIVVDADSIVPIRFVETLRNSLISGRQAVQARVAPLVEDQDPVTILAALSEEMEQRIYEQLRFRLGWPGRMRGTGMAFRIEALRRVASNLITSIEDAELSLLLADQGIRAIIDHRTYVVDPKPINANAASRQRARWLMGQSQLVRQRRPLLVRLLGKGPGAWSLLAAIFLKPRTLFLPAYAGLALMGLALHIYVPGINLLSILLSIPLLTNLLGLMLALHLCPAEMQASALRALVSGHRYLAMWLSSTRKARKSRDPWLRARPRTGKKRIGEATTAGR